MGGSSSKKSTEPPIPTYYYQGVQTAPYRASSSNTSACTSASAQSAGTAGTSRSTSTTSPAQSTRNIIARPEQRTNPRSSNPKVFARLQAEAEGRELPKKTKMSKKQKIRAAKRAEKGRAEQVNLEGTGPSTSATRSGTVEQRSLVHAATAGSSDAPLRRDEDLPDAFELTIFWDFYSRMSVGDWNNPEAHAQVRLDQYFEAKGSDANTPVYMMGVKNERVCVFEPARDRFIIANRRKWMHWAIKESDLYMAELSDNPAFLAFLTTACHSQRDSFLRRSCRDLGSETRYRNYVLPALLLGSRVRDFEQRCATVEEIREDRIVLGMPPQRSEQALLMGLQLQTSTGTLFNLGVIRIYCNKVGELDKNWTVHCSVPKNEILPPEVCEGAKLEIVRGPQQQAKEKRPPVTVELEWTFRNKEYIHAWPLLERIYGASRTDDVWRSTNHFRPPRIREATGKHEIKMLNVEQTAAIARYNDDECPAFVVEAPPGSGKTMTASAMALSYKGDGVQLFLSTANVPVINMAIALWKLELGGLKALHLLSLEKSPLSPFSEVSLALKDERIKELVSELYEEFRFTSNDEDRAKLRGKIHQQCRSIYADNYDVYFATVDTILGKRQMEDKYIGEMLQVDHVKTRLRSVRRIVIDEASQLTEAALNALILSFPKAQIVLIGDSKQLPPFKYVEGEVVSELAARSSLDVIKAKKNLPVINLTRIYRASPRLSAHYSDVFYEGALVSVKPESARNLLASLGSRSGGRRCLFWQVKGQSKQSGTSKVNDNEIATLRYMCNMLRSSNLDHRSVMIISYYEAQRKLAQAALPSGYEVLTVDSAQGRENKIVIVLTTTTSVPREAGGFFSCPLRCNVAVSRHQEALIVLGHPSLLSAPSWSRILSDKYFKHVESLNRQELHRLKKG